MTDIFFSQFNFPPVDFPQTLEHPIHLSINWEEVRVWRGFQILSVPFRNSQSNAKVGRGQGEVERFQHDLQQYYFGIQVSFLLPYSLSTTLGSSNTQWQKGIKVPCISYTDQGAL